MSSEQEIDENFQEGAAEDDAGAEGQAADADFTDEDWDAEGGHSEEGDQAEEAGDGVAPKKKMKTNMIIIGAAVVVGLGVLYWQMSKRSVKLPPPAAMQAVAPADPTEMDMITGHKTGEPEPKTDKNKPAAGGLLTDPNLIKKVQKMSDNHVPTNEELAPEAQPAPSLVPKEVKTAPPMPAPITQAGPQAPKHEEDQPLTPMPQEAHGAALTTADTGKAPAPAPVPAPTATKGEKPVNLAPATASLVPAATPGMKAPASGTMTPVTMAPPSAAPAPGSVTAPASAGGVSSAQMEQITAKLDGIESQLKTLKDLSASRDELASLKTQMENLQDKVANLAENGVKAPGAVAPEKAAGAPHKTHAHAVHKASPMVAAVHKMKPAGQQWILKSAQPGWALVTKGDGQFLTIKTGEKVPGLGRIKTIDEVKGRWVVKGSAGSITQ